MTPALVQPQVSEIPQINGGGSYKEAYGVAGGPASFDFEAERLGHGPWGAAKYPHYLPSWDFSKKYPPLEAFEHHDRGLFAEPTCADLLENAEVEDITPNFGTEVHGIQLSQLTEDGKDQLALFTARKKLVVFRNQDFADLPVEDAVKLASHYGPLHVHPTSGSINGFPEVHVVYRNAGDVKAKGFFNDRLSSTAWHTDTSYEIQPPGTTFLYMLEGPKSGGDTVFSDQVEAYNRLSPLFQSRLHGLTATHSGLEQSSGSAGVGGVVRREPVATSHPVVRTHPVTGEKALYVNPQFCKRIDGLKIEESNMLLKFLFDHMAYGQDFQARVKWSPGTVIVWDNRLVAHSALTDWHGGGRRHIARLTPQAERPYETPFQ